MSSPSARNGSATAPGLPGSQRFPQFRRLRKRAEFQRVYEEGVRLTSALFSAFVRDAQTNEPGKVGFTVPRAIGGAVVRNRVKRRLREAIRRRWADLPDGYEVVIHARKRLVDVEWTKLESEIQRVFRRAFHGPAESHTERPGR